MDDWYESLECIVGDIEYSDPTFNEEGSKCWLTYYEPLFHSYDADMKNYWVVQFSFELKDVETNDEKVYRISHIGVSIRSYKLEESN